jgi:cyanophycinase
VRPVFLIGGGRDQDGVAISHRPFVQATGPGPIVCLVADEGEGVDAQRWSGGLRSAGADDIRVVRLGVDRPVRPDDVVGAAGIYVAGGLTPLYQHLLVGAGTDWLPQHVPYAGFSAGAAVAATSAIIGGWRIGDLAVCSADASEDLDQIDPQPGLGLTPFTVDVHATQWGTLTRLIHTVATGLVVEGWAIDEHACLSAGNGGLSVHGIGCAYRVVRGHQEVTVRVVRSAETDTPSG